jgi:hypothetical protein
VIDIIPPDIYYTSEELPTTGDEFIIEAYAEDNYQVMDFYLEYWMDFDYHVNITFKGSHRITAPSNGENLYCIFTALDEAGNLRSIRITLDIIDNDAPIIDDKVPKPTTGDEFSFDFTVSDNVAIILTTLEYWFDNEEPVKIDSIESNKKHTTTAPTYSKILHYTIITKDIGGNYAIVSEIVNVIDNDPPSITDHSFQSGSNVEFKADVNDNIELDKVLVNYWYEDGIINAIELQLLNGYYFGQISLPDNIEKLYYVIVANDTSDNWGNSDEVDLDFAIQEQFSPSAESNMESSWIIIFIIIIIVIIGLIGVVYPFFKRSKRRAETQEEPSQVQAGQYKLVNDKTLPIIPTVKAQPEPSLIPTTKPTIQPATISQVVKAPQISTPATNTPQLPPHTPPETHVTTPIELKPTIQPPIQNNQVVNNPVPTIAQSIDNNNQGGVA